MAFAKINGITVHYELIGNPDSKKLVVFSNSLGTDFRIWLPLFDELGDDVSVLLYDSRGHGLTETGDPAFTMENLVDDLIGLVEHLGIKKAVFCGLSVGGLIVQGLWGKRPDLVKKIILCDTAAKVGNAESWNGRIKTVNEKGIGAIAEAVMKLWFTPDFHAQRTADLAGYSTMLVRQSVEGYNATCAAIRDADYTEAARSVAVPTLVLVGDQDGSTPPDLVRATADLISGAEFAIIEDCGHIPCVEQPEQLAALIDSFIRKA
ncbi:3-oxoadipate enol-lactonase [Rhizobiaceae bacterium n13]|uniref:3-oxoadipate enol-lactonase n=1 Tax=Ferirhizobium litorale TaxID=2927786 RepID=A0AAE3QF40_9HYPH|nr:3-oxoadipate enol-lactonase [Fererhizobium litorale]MDI7862879.1 3-oxoadipate enol-lactonase [Fererhizobium litorale]MDI7923965.1 3-oxoadipate enol-lactonase [Fererhizobium litorale]